MSDFENLEILKKRTQEQYGPSIKWVKEQIGEGMRFSNSIADVVISEKGAYYQFRNLPEEFSGMVGESVDWQLVDRSRSMEIVDQMMAMSRVVNAANTRRLILAFFYEPAVLRRSSSFLFHADYSLIPRHMLRPSESGFPRPGAMPIFYKLTADSELAVPLLDGPKGILFGLSGVGPQDLLIRFPHKGNDLVDLGKTPPKTSIN
jgi:hypothetical protein